MTSPAYLQRMNLGGNTELVNLEKNRNVNKAASSKTPRVTGRNEGMFSPKEIY